jgi:hypothetical protein
LGLNSACDVAGLRTELVKHCIEYQSTLNKSKNIDEQADLDLETLMREDS